MAMNFANRSPAPAAAGQTAAPAAGRTRMVSGQTEQRVAAQFWINFGFVAGDVFVSLNKGIALDDIESMDESSSNEEFAEKAQAANKFRDDLIEEAGKLKAGESIIIAYDEHAGLAVQLRRVRDKSKSTIDRANNRLLGSYKIGNVAGEAAE